MSLCRIGRSLDVSYVGRAMDSLLRGVHRIYGVERSIHRIPALCRQPDKIRTKRSSAGEPVLECSGALGWTAGAMHTICHLRVLALACCSSLERAPWLGLATAESIESGLVTPTPAGMQRRLCIEAGHFSRTRHPQLAPLRALQMPIAMATLPSAQCEPQCYLLSGRRAARDWKCSPKLRRSPATASGNHGKPGRSWRTRAL